MAADSAGLRLVLSADPSAIVDGIMPLIEDFRADLNRRGVSLAR